VLGDLTERDWNDRDGRRSPGVEPGRRGDLDAWVPVVFTGFESDGAGLGWPMRFRHRGGLLVLVVRVAGPSMCEAMRQRGAGQG
jgi:hypothetical protein